MDTWGEYLIACSNADGKIYEWQLGFTTPTLAAAITNAPTGNKAVLVTAERILFALGAGGNPRKVQWCDQENNTLWTPAGDNQAGDYELATPGTLLAGKRVKGVNLLFTDVDVHTAQYVGAPSTRHPKSMRSTTASLVKSGGITPAVQVMKMTVMSLSITEKTTGT
jgi:hypothetical protein